MKIAIFGGSRGVGAEAAAQALERGWRCRVLARSADGVADLPGVEVVVGDARDPEPVGRTLFGCDGVLITLGPHRGHPPDLCSHATRVIVEAMAEQQVPRVAAVTALGVGDSYARMPAAYRLLIRTLMRRLMADKEAQESILRDSDREWIIVRPGRLVDRPASARYRVSVDGGVSPRAVARADVAAFLLDQLVSDRYLRKAPGIA